MVAARFGYNWAIELGQAHELGTPLISQQRRVEAQIDLHNNKVGARYGVNSGWNWNDPRIRDELARVVDRGIDYFNYHSIEG
ncbi:DUF6973 domain-containing protein [Parafrankia sp. FMc2]|uniref:DUF6973 domain-containing protein n=1 Tax=Parafrankia sp. FMc2 TaxID=3233196 RepID=UPI0034D59B46